MLSMLPGAERVVFCRQAILWRGQTLHKTLNPLVIHVTQLCFMGVFGGFGIYDLPRA